MKSPIRNLRSVKRTYLLFSCLWILLGLALLLFPGLSSAIICYALGGLCLVWSVVKLIGYFSRDPYRLAFQFDLALAVFCLILGLVLIFFSRAVISMLPVIVGIFTVVSGVFKLQTAFEARRFGIASWPWLLVLSVAAIVIGALVLILPYQTALLGIRLMGLAILVGGIEDLTATACTVNTKKNGTVIDVDDFWEV